jgi:putative ABC transport system permease protein
MIVAPRWRKVMADLLGNKSRTLLVVLSIGVGVFAVGFVSTSFMVLLGDMEKDYSTSNPHSAIIFCDNFDEDLIKVAQRLPGVAEVEGRSSITGRVVISSEKIIPISISAIESFEKLNIDRIRPASNGEKLSLEDHEIFIDRTAISELKITPGDNIVLEMPDGKNRTIKVAAFVHDVNGPPYTFTGQFSGYVTPHTIEWLGGSRFYNALYLTVSENKKEESHVRDVAQIVSDKIEGSGRQVYYTFVMQPGRHWASDMTQALGMIMGVLGAFSVFLSGFLVVNTISSLLSQQIRQIGMMKAVGARTGQVFVMYLVMVIGFGLGALCIALPLSSWAGYWVAAALTGFLNFDVYGFRIPLASLLLQIFVALVIPVAAALVPVKNGTRLTIREALSNYGMGAGQFGKGLLDIYLEKIRFLSRPLLISLRNTFRRKGRLLLTLSTLTLAGAIFIAVFNLKFSFADAIDATLGYFLSDVNISFNKPYRYQQIAPILFSVPGVVGAEGWGFSNAQVLTTDKKSATAVLIFAPPSGSKLIKPSLIEGRWLTENDENAIVIGNHLLKKRPELKVGEKITLSIDNKENSWIIVGSYKMAGNVDPPIIYANNEYLAQITNQIDQIIALRLITNPHDAATEERVAKNLEVKFREKGLDVSDIATGAAIRQQNISTTNILVYFLLVMACLIALVGGLGLTGTMSMNVMERTREIGVMRAIGASDSSIIKLVVVEGMVIGVISWILGALLSIPISSLLNYVVGVAILNSPLDFKFSFGGFIVWLIGVLTIAAIASIIPARNASRLTVREVLAYE